MKKIKVILLILVSLTFFVNADDIVVTAEGQAEGTGLSAKEKALEDALRNAVESGFGVYIDSATLVDNASLISDETVAETKGFIRSYKILNERDESGIHTTTIRAVISMDKIWESDSLNLLLKRMGAPRFIVVSSESVDGETPKGNPALQKMTEKLIKRGFTLVDSVDVEKLSGVKRENIVANMNSAIEFGSSAGAEIVVLVKAKAFFENKKEIYGKDMLYFNGISRANVVRVDSKKIIASSSGKSIRGGTTPEEAIFDTLSFATEESSEPLIRSILKSWANYLNMGRSIEVIIRNVSVSELSRIIEALKTIEGVSAVSQRGYSNKTATLEIKSKHKAIYLSESIENLPGLNLEISSFSSGKISAIKK